MTTVSTNRQRLDEIIERFRVAYNDFYPHNAFFILGIHEYAGRVPDFSSASIDSWLESLNTFAHELQTTIAQEDLDKLGQFDYKLVTYFIELEKLKHGSLQFYTRNPIMPYIYIFDVSNYVKRSYAPLPQRIDALCNHLEATPKLIEQLMQLLGSSLPRAAIEISLETFNGFASYYKGGSLLEQVATAVAEENATGIDMMRVESAALAAGTALENYVEFFREHLTHADENFAVGADNYLAMLKWGEMVELSLDELLELAMADVRRNQAGVQQICHQIDSNATVQAVMERIAADHPDNDEVVPTTRRYMESIRDYLIKAQVVDVPAELNCIVDEMPLFMRWIFADMETPGPFETKATEAHFYITPANSEWPVAQQEAWLSRFNHYVIQIFSLHEAYPGHYLQHLHARQSYSIAAKNLTSYSFIEGWAHYCEQMVLEEGYGRENPETFAKLQLAQLEEALVRDCRFICGLGLHTQGWSVEQAVEFYQANAYMTEATARKEAQRSTFDPAGLNYTLGKLLFYKLRQDYQAEKGEQFDLREFHNQCLAYGMPPIVLLRLVLLQEDTQSVL